MMKTWTLPAGIFLASFGLCAWLLQSREISGPATADSLTAKQAATAPPRNPHQDASALVSNVRSFLRAGDIEGARQLLAEAAADPEVLFLALEKLPLFPGIEALISEAAAKLPWKEQHITALLNRIASPAWRDLAWESYAAARVGEVSDEEVFLTALAARRSNWTAGIDTLMRKAAADHPVEFMDLLNREGGTSVREAFLEMVMKTNPQLGGELYRSIPSSGPGSGYDRTYALQARVVTLPTADNLRESLADAGERSGYTSLGTNLVSEAYSRADPAERQKIRDDLAGRPPLERTRLLRGALFSNQATLDSGELVALLDLSPSPRLQRDALDSWLEKHPEAGDDPAWIESLPSTQLKEQAASRLNSTSSAQPGR